jgi:hypothetical protein
VVHGGVAEVEQVLGGQAGAAGVVDAHHGCPVRVPGPADRHRRRSAGAWARAPVTAGFGAVLTGVYGIDGGEVRLDGQQVRFTGPLQAQHAAVSTVYQEVNLCPNLSVAENIFIGREPRRFGKIRWAEMRRRAAELLRRLDLDLDVSAPLNTYLLAIYLAQSSAFRAKVFRRRTPPPPPVPESSKKVEVPA